MQQREKVAEIVKEEARFIPLGRLGASQAGLHGAQQVFDEPD
jgi:hypothetical protein